MFDAECLSGAALITKAPGLLDQIATSSLPGSTSIDVEQQFPVFSDGTPPLFYQAPHIVDQSGPSPPDTLPTPATTSRVQRSEDGCFVAIGLTEVEDGRVQSGTDTWECRFWAIEFGSDVQ